MMKVSLTFLVMIRKHSSLLRTIIIEDVTFGIVRMCDTLSFLVDNI